MNRRRPAQLNTRALRGAALLEVILALALFVAVAAVVTSTMRAALDSLDRQRLRTHAGNLAATILAELQLGIRPAASAAAQPFEAPFENWTWELAISPLESETGEASRQSLFEVVVRHHDPEIVQRLARVFPLSDAARPGAAAPIP